MSIIFFWFVLQQPIFYPDSYSYLRADIVRSPGYVLFLRGLQFVFEEGFDVIAVYIQTLFCLTAIYIIFKMFCELLKLKLLSKIFLFLILIFPLFPPLEIVNNITSESLSYTFFLIGVSNGIVFIEHENRKNLLVFFISTIALILTRGQFIIVPVIFGFIFLLKYRKKITRKKNILILSLFLLTPIVTNLGEKTYRKLVHSHFVSPPYTFVNAVTLPLYTSKIEDSIFIKNPIDRKIFIQSIRHIDSMNLLSSKINGSFEEKYKTFHNNFPLICNQNIFVKGKAIHYKLNQERSFHVISTEKSCKNLTGILIKNNLKNYLSVYFSGVFNGYYSVFIFLFVIIVSITYLIKNIKIPTLENSFILTTTLLFLSNSLIVAFASHSIMRYLFYNYFLGFLVIVLLLRKLKFAR